MKNFNYLIFLLSLIIFSSSVMAKVGWREFKSPRLYSTAGAGVGSILFQDSIYANPASVAFFNKSGFGYQNTDYNSQTKSKERNGMM
jgi:hypothetical protein